MAAIERIAVQSRAAASFQAGKLSSRSHIARCLLVKHNVAGGQRYNTKCAIAGRNLLDDLPFHWLLCPMTFL